jgi:hypothetical protein
VVPVYIHNVGPVESKYIEPVIGNPEGSGRTNGSTNPVPFETTALKFIPLGPTNDQLDDDTFTIKSFNAIVPLLLESINVTPVMLDR